MNDPVLLELFNRLRQAGLPLGLEEYHILLQALDAGFGRENRDVLEELCRTLWIKSEEEEQIFQDYFEQLIPKGPPVSILLANISSDSQTLFNEKVTDKKHKFYQTKYYLIFGLTSLLVVVLYFLSVWRQPENDHRNNPGVLSFSTIPFTNRFISREDDKAIINVTRTGGSSGEVSAKLVLDEANDYFAGSKVSDFDPSEDEERLALKDFDANSLSVFFKDGEVGEKSFILTPLDDKVFEGNEEITLKLINPQGGVKINTKSQAILIVVDDDIINDGTLELPEEIRAVGDNLLSIIAVCLALLVTWKIREIHKSSDSYDDVFVDSTDLSQARLSSEVVQAIADGIQFAEVIKQTADQRKKPFFLVVKDLPITFRQMKQGWRHLRNFVREGTPTELDLEATLRQIGQHGLLLNPVLRPRRINKLELLLLIDQDGSMVPFHHLSEGLVRTASQGGRFSQVRTYYFHNCPDEYLYEDPYHLKAVTIEGCLSQLSKTRVVCLIFSDAGAARGGFNSRRRRRTKFLLKQIRQYVPNIVWLNPVPRQRWQGTSAAAIANIVPMFEANRQEFYSAIDALRGRYQIGGALQHND